jgi:hypothetical protein
VHPPWLFDAGAYCCGALAPGLDIARDGVGAALRLDLRIQLGTAK